MSDEEKATTPQFPQLYPSLSQANTDNDLRNKDENDHAAKSDTKKYEVSRVLDIQGDTNSGEKKDYKYFWKRVLKDLTNKNLIPVKILFFFKYATLFVLYPFLTLHMDALGLDEWEIGVNQASVPIVAILGPPISGVIADKIGNFKLVLAFITLINAAVALLLLLVPVARETVQLPHIVTYEISCDPSSHNFILNSIDQYTCSLNSSVWTNLPENNIIQCGQLCKISTNITNNSTDDFPSLPIQLNSPINYDLNNESYQFTPFETHPQFACADGGVSQNCSLIGSSDQIYRKSGDNGLTLGVYYSKISFSKLVLMDANKLKLNSSFKSESNLELLQPRFLVEGPIVYDSVLHDNPTCTQPSEEPITTTGDNDCETKCFLQLERKVICSNDKVRKVYNVGLTFGMYTVFRLLLGFASATSFIMFEGAVLAILKRYGGDYGLQRVSATFAAIIAAPISGMLLQNYSFKPVFYLYAGLQAFSAVLTLKIDLTFKKPSDNVIRHLREVLSQLEILIFFAAMLCSGTAWGYLETFLFLFLKNLGGSQTLMGLTISVGGLFGLPFLIFSRPIIKKVGHINVLCIGLLFYGLRYFGYSIIYNPWLCLPFEALESVTASLAITAAATYAVALSTLQTIATVQGIMGALYFGIGRGAGSFIGGLLIKKFGHRQTFQIFGIGSFVACLLYLLVNILYLRKHSKAGSGIDINNMNGSMVISNGSAKLKSNENTNEQFQMKPANHDEDMGYGKINPGFEDGDVEDGTKFTDIPLDEEISNVHNNNKPRRA